MNTTKVFSLIQLIILVSSAFKTSSSSQQQQQQSCSIYNSLYNYTFDLSSIHLASGQYRIKTKSFEYFINPCSLTKDSQPAVTRTVISNNKTAPIVYGYNNKATLNYITSHIVLNYEGEKCTANSTRNTLILFECSPFSDMPPDLVAEEECLLTIRWAVRSACVKQTNNNQCAVFYADHLYNLAPLTHNLDSWRIESAKSTFWLNVCQGVFKGPGDDRNCPKNAAICMHDQISGKTETLALTDQAQIKIKNDAYSIEVVYNNTRLPCAVNSKFVQNYTITYVEYKCGQTIGNPKLLNNADKAVKEMPIFLSTSANECIYVFEWSTRIACKNETQLESRVEVQNGIIYDTRHSQVEIDMTEILNNSTEFVDNEDLRPDSDDSFEYFIRFKGNMSGLSGNAKDCQDSIVCRYDKKRKYYVSLGNQIDYFAFDVYTEILEVVVSSSRIKCPNNSGKIHSIIRFYCDHNKNGFERVNSFNFETDYEDCVYTFNWPTKRLCVRDLWMNGTYNVKPITQNFTKHYLTTGLITKTPTTQNPALSSSNQIPSFIIISLILLIIVLLLVLFNHLPQIFESRYCRLCRQGCFKDVCSNDWIFNCFDCIRTVKWFGSVRRRLTPRRRDNSRLHGVRYKRVKHLDDNDSESDNLLNSSSDEVTAVFNSGSEHSHLRLTELTPVSLRGISSKKTSSLIMPNSHKASRYPASDSSNFNEFEDQMDEIDAGENVKNSTFLTRRDSRNNMLNNTDTDDDLIVV